MGKFLHLAKQAFIYARTRPMWWVLAFLQVVFIGLQARYWRLAALSPVYLALWLVVFFLLMLAFLVLWVQVKAVQENQPVNWKIKTLPDYFLVGITAYILIRLLPQVIASWAPRAVVSSALSVSFLAAALGCCLLGLVFTRGFKLSVDLWRHQGLVMSAAVLLVLIFHGLFFSLGHLGMFYSHGTWAFSGLELSATIWSLLFVMVVVLTVCVLWLNVFLVIVFLDLVGTQKPKEPVLAAQGEPAAQTAG